MDNAAVDAAIPVEVAAHEMMDQMVRDLVWRGKSEGLRLSGVQPFVGKVGIHDRAANPHFGCWLFAHYNPILPDLFDPFLDGVLRLKVSAIQFQMLLLISGQK